MQTFPLFAQTSWCCNALGDSQITSGMAGGYPRNYVQASLAGLLLDLLFKFLVDAPQLIVRLLKFMSQSHILDFHFVTLEGFRDIGAQQVVLPLVWRSCGFAATHLSGELSVRACSARDKDVRSRAGLAHTYVLTEFF